MNEVKFDGHRVLVALKEIVRETGVDYVYPPAKAGGECFYNKEGIPQCIVGRVLSKLVPDFEPEEQKGALHLPLQELGFDMDARRILQMAQAMQDGGETYGSAVHAAENLLYIDHTVRYSSL